MKRLDFAWSSAKDLACLKPLYNEFLNTDWEVTLVKIHRHNFRNRKAVQALAEHVVVAYDLPIKRIRRRGYKGEFIYVDHGVGPVKYYAYRYRALHDVALMFYEGEVFQRKMAACHPEYRNGLLGGFTKIDELVNLQVDRRELCRETGLDPDAPIILFAPTWGGKKSEHWGIRNARYLTDVPNVIISPHPSDSKYAARFNAVIPKQKGNLNTFIRLADLVISDISSVVGEAAAIGKPSIQLILESYPGTFPMPDERRNADDWISKDLVAREIADTDRSQRPFKIPYLDEDWLVDRACCPEDLPETITEALNDPDANKAQRSYWGEQCCWKADGRSCARMAGMIRHYIQTGERLQIRD